MYAVNAPMIAPETMSVIAPYLPVAEKTASLATQLARGQMGDIEIEYLGEIAQHDTTPLKAAVIKGLLAPISEENVTIVNAQLIAENRGLRIVERKGPSDGVYANLIRVHIHTSEGETDVAGIVAHDGPHIVEINDFVSRCLDAARAGCCCARTTTGRARSARWACCWAKHNINIGTMSVGLDEARGRALMALRVRPGRACRTCSRN